MNEKKIIQKINFRSKHNVLRFLVLSDFLMKKSLKFCKATHLPHDFRQISRKIDTW